MPVPTVAIPLGPTVRVIDLLYTTMNPEKPFPDATLLAFANGAYRIASDGEDHYGSYVDTAADTIVFLSWPSADWADNVAMHTLVFGDDGRFSQVLVQPGGARSTQGGRWADRAEPAGYAADTPWAELRRAMS